MLLFNSSNIERAYSIRLHLFIPKCSIPDFFSVLKETDQRHLLKKARGPGHVKIYLFSFFLFCGYFP